MNIYLLFCVLCQFYLSTSIKIKLELKKNILNFGYGINYKYEGMLAHSFDRFYVINKFILPIMGDLNFSKLNYDDTCTYIDNKNVQNTETRKYMLDLKTFGKKIEPFVVYYRKLINSYNKTGQIILEKEIKLLLPQVERKQKHGIITTLVSSFIGLEYEEISSFLHHKQNNTLHKTVNAMNDKANIQHNKLMKSENSMLMYSVYNAETLEKLINTVHDLNVYELITQLSIFALAIRILAKGYLPNSLLTLVKLQEILMEVRKTLRVTNPDCDLVIDQIHLYYEMPLVTFSIEKDGNLIIQFPVFVQPYTQKHLVLYQLKLFQFLFWIRMSRCTPTHIYNSQNHTLH